MLKHFQQLAIEISGRNPRDNPNGLPYHLVAEGCMPAINVTDIGKVMEEHRVVNNLTAYQLNNQFSVSSTCTVIMRNINVQS